MKPPIFSLVCVLLCCGSTFAQRRELRPQVRALLINDVEQGKIATHPLTRYLETSSAAVVDVDLTKIELQKAMDWLAENFEPARRNPPPPDQIAMGTGFVESLKAAGVEHLYITASTRSIFDGGPVLVIPCQTPPAVHGLAALVVQTLPKERNYTVHVGDDVVVVGPKNAIDRVLAADGADRADLIAPLLAAKRSDHMAVFSLPAEAKDQLVTLWPDSMPKAANLEISPKALAKNLQSISIGWALPPQPSLSARVETTDEAGTQQVQSAIDQLLNLSPEAEKAVDVSTDAAGVSVSASPKEIVSLLEALTAPARDKAGNQMIQNDLKQIGLAMHNYHNRHKHFPPRVMTTPDGKPLLGWRVTILPYIEQAVLAQQMKWGKAWDSPENKLFTETVIPVYSRNMMATDHPAKTRIRVPVMKGSFWQGAGKPRSIVDIRDGTSGTIAAIMAPEKDAVAWTSPESWIVSEQDPMSDVFGDRDSVNVLFFDGSVRRFSKREMNNNKLKAMLTYDGGEHIEW